jgi:hypothetical protein
MTSRLVDMSSRIVAEEDGIVICEPTAFVDKISSCWGEVLDVIALQPDSHFLRGTPAHVIL